MSFYENNRAFQNMRRDALAMLADKDPKIIALRADVTFDSEKKEFLVPSLGRIYTFTYPEYETQSGLDPWHHLTMLHYLNLADGTPTAEIPCAFAELPDGMVRGGNFDRTASEVLCRFAKLHSESEIREIMQGFGAEFLEGKADLSVRLPYLPHYPVFMNIWFADEEFPPSVRMLVDRNSWHHLTIEDAVTVGEYMLRLLEKAD